MGNKLVEDPVTGYLVQPTLCSACLAAPVCTIRRALDEIESLGVEIKIDYCPFYVGGGEA